MYKCCFKRALDFLISLIGLVFFVPILILPTLLLFITNRGTPFFVQVRPGKHGRLFNVIKFKTMNDKRDKNGKLFPDADRLTPLGKLMRNTSLDEIPQLLNVLKGDMSLIGPRPLLVEYLPLYNDVQKRRHEVKPGITGWAQVNGRNTITWQQKFEYDVWYVDHISILLDFNIVYLTIKKVFNQEGINQQGQATVGEFNGYN